MAGRWSQIALELACEEGLTSHNSTEKSFKVVKAPVQRDPNPSDLQLIPPRPPVCFKDILSHLKSPVVTCLVRDRTDFWRVLILPVVPDRLDSRTDVLIEQQSAPSACRPNALFPSTDLPIVILASPPRKKSAVPLEPAPNVPLVLDPTIGLPLFNTLPASYLEFVGFRVVCWGGQEVVDVESVNPRRGELEIIVGNGRSEFLGIEWSEVGSPKSALTEDLGWRFVGREIWVRCEMERSGVISRRSWR